MSTWSNIIQAYRVRAVHNEKQRQKDPNGFLALYQIKYPNQERKMDKPHKDFAIQERTFGAVMTICFSLSGGMASGNILGAHIPVLVVIMPLLFIALVMLLLVVMHLIMKRR
jgi:hypothetical protein